MKSVPKFRIRISSLERLDSILLLIICQKNAYILLTVGLLKENMKDIDHNQKKRESS